MVTSTSKKKKLMVIVCWLSDAPKGTWFLIQSLIFDIPNGFYFEKIKVNTICRFLRRILPRSRIMVFGFAIKAVLVITTCTRNIVTLLWMELSNRCTPRWLLATESGSLASRLLRLRPSQLSYARGTAPSSFTTLKSSSPWCSKRWGHLAGSWRQPTRHQGLTCLCNFLRLIKEN